MSYMKLKFPEIFIATPLGPIIVEFMLGPKWHLGDLQRKVAVMKVSFVKSKCK